MTTQHTQGEWKDGPVFNKETRAIFYTDTSKAGKWQRRLDADKDGCFSPEHARLIAAAPKLLEALEAVFSDYNRASGTISGKSDMLAKTAIAAAKGE